MHKSQHIKKAPTVVNVNYDSLDLNTADIWAYEFALTKGANEHSLYDMLIETIEPLISQKCKPFLTNSEAKSNNVYVIGYSQRYACRQTDYFLWDDDYFDYQENLVIRYEEVETKAFALLFALKLRQYNDNLTALDGFLYYQLEANFNSNLEEFVIFLKGILIQYPEFLGPKFEKKIFQWREDFNPLAVIQTGQFAVLNDPDYWTPIMLLINDERSRTFFSFLYLERTNAGKPFLEKKEFDLLFRFGLKVPPIPLPKKFKLHTTPQYRKSIIECCTYLFYERYSANLKNKMAFLQFLAYQLEDFSHIKEDKDFKNWGKNFTKNKLKMDLPFDIQKYFDLIK